MVHHHDDACGTVQRLRDGEVSATELVEDCLAAIASPLQKEINAFVFVDEEGARRAAARVDNTRAKGGHLGPLAGVPFGVKELQQVAGWPDTLASEAFADRVAEQTDTMTRRLVEAGAVPVGLTASPELGRSSFCSTPLHGTTRNPWDLSLTPGGSSSGSAAAVAAGITTFCTGSDGAGSLRIPASFCGVVGYKPTNGLLPRGPKFGGTAGNQAYGPLATTVRDVAVFINCVAGVDDGEVGSVPSPGGFLAGLDDLSSGLRIGFSAGLGYSPVDPGVRAATEEACARLVAAAEGTAVGLDGEVSLPDGSQAFRTLSMVDVWDQVRGLPEERMALLDRSVRQYSDFVREATFDDYIDAQRLRARLTRVVSELFDRVDLLVTPATPVTAFGAEGPMPRRIDGEDVDHWGSLRLTYPFNLTGHPAISLPLNQVNGPPIGMQIVTRRFADRLLLRAAARFEAASPWKRHAVPTAVTA
jgi:aspartyl-tRNA(Asn)/glutamyl-tRNA(Gln) amidotransferase subunit A